jgi:ribosomal protein S18 acetylase RimI-like enzyme
MTLLRRLRPGGQPSDGEVMPLTPSTALRLRPSLIGRFTSEMIAQQVEVYPDLAFSVARQNQYGVGGLWRRRDDIGEVVEVSRGPFRQAILRRLLDAFEARGVTLVVLDFEEGAGHAGFYAQEGFTTIDRIVEYERQIQPPVREVRAVPVRAYQPDDFEAVVEVDHASFPWLWWNSESELDTYLHTPGVEIYVSLDGGGRPVGYAGLTIRGTFVHLDRLAVHEAYQRRHHGATLLTFVLDEMRAIGVRRIALSTQEDNYRSQALYERYGFSRGRWSYDIRGIWLREPVPA